MLGISGDGLIGSMGRRHCGAVLDSEKLIINPNYFEGTSILVLSCRIAVRSGVGRFVVISTSLVKENTDNSCHQCLRQFLLS